jgi:uncharacterized protein YjaG (DUF416 family)
MTSKKSSKPKKGGVKKKVKKVNKRNTVKPKKGMSQANVVKILEFLKVIRRVPTDDFKVLVKYLNDDACNMLSECIHNSLCSSALSDLKKKKLRDALWKHKTQLRFLSKGKTNMKKKRDILPQIGGSIGLIISAVLPILMNMLRGARK